MKYLQQIRDYKSQRNIIKVIYNPYSDNAFKDISVCAYIYRTLLRGSHTFFHYEQYVVSTLMKLFRQGRAGSFPKIEGMPTILILGEHSVKKDDTQVV